MLYGIVSMLCEEMLHLVITLLSTFNILSLCCMQETISFN